MKKFLKALYDYGIRYRMSMTSETSGKVYKLGSDDLWFEFSSPAHGLEILEKQ